MSPLGELPSNLEKVADVGGWDARAAEQAKEVINEIKQIKPAQWKGLNETLNTLKGILDLDVTSAFTQMGDSIKETVNLQIQQATAPLINTLNAEFNKILEPLLPFIQDMVNLIIPLIQTIGGWIQNILDELAIQVAAGGPWEQAWASDPVQWILTHPGSTYVDYLLEIELARISQQSSASQDRPGGYRY